jgi:hypothetical protein
MRDIFRSSLVSDLSSRVPVGSSPGEMINVGVSGLFLPCFKSKRYLGTRLCQHDPRIQAAPWGQRLTNSRSHMVQAGRFGGTVNPEV